MALWLTLTIYFIGETGSVCCAVWCIILVLVSARISLSRFRYSERSVVWTDGCFAAVVNFHTRSKFILISLSLVLMASYRHWRSTNLVESHSGVFAFCAAYRFPCLSPIKRVAWVDSRGRAQFVSGLFGCVCQVCAPSRPTGASSECTLLLWCLSSCLCVEKLLCRVMCVSNGTCVVPRPSAHRLFYLPGGGVLHFKKLL